MRAVAPTHKRAVLYLLALLATGQTGCMEPVTFLRFGAALDLLSAPLAFLAGLFAA